MTDEPLIEALRKLSERVKLSMKEICEIARTIVQADFDPLRPEELGEIFVEWRRVPVFDDDDFTTLVEPVPSPHAQVDLLRAWLEYFEDLRNAEYAIGRKPSIEQLLMLAANERAWLQFWTVRHPDREMRARFESALAEFEALATSVKAKAGAMISRRGIVRATGEVSDRGEPGAKR